MARRTLKTKSKVLPLKKRIGKSVEDRMPKEDSQETVVRHEQTGTIADKPVDKKIDEIISSRADAMNKFDLMPKTVGIKALLQPKEDNHLEIAARINRMNKQEQATQYIVEGLKRDKKHIEAYLNNLLK